MARKYARMFVAGIDLLREANSFPRAWSGSVRFEEQIRGTDNNQRQIREHIFAYFPSKSFRNTDHSDIPLFNAGEYLVT